MSLALLIGGPADGEKVPVPDLADYGFCGGIRWRDEPGVWVFWTEVPGYRYYVHDSLALPVLEDDGA